MKARGAGALARAMDKKKAILNAFFKQTPPVWWSLPNVLGLKHERQQRTRSSSRDSKESGIGASRGNLGQDLRRRHRSSPWIALRALRMITLPRTTIYPSYQVSQRPVGAWTCGSPRGDLSHIAGLTLGRSRSDFSGANLRAQDNTCGG